MVLSMFAIGSPVRIGAECSEVVGTVTAATVRHQGHLTYEVVWWDGRCRKSDWLEGVEVFPADDSIWVEVRDAVSGRRDIG